MYPNPEMAKTLAREKAEALQQAAQQHRLLQGRPKPFRRRLASLLAQLAQRLDAEVSLNPKPS